MLVFTSLLALVYLSCISNVNGIPVDTQIDQSHDNCNGLLNCGQLGNNIGNNVLNNNEVLSNDDLLDKDENSDEVTTGTGNENDDTSIESLTEEAKKTIEQLSNTLPDVPSA